MPRGVTNDLISLFCTFIYHGYSQPRLIQTPLIGKFTIFELFSVPYSIDTLLKPSLNLYPRRSGRKPLRIFCSN